MDSLGMVLMLSVVVLDLASSSVVDKCEKIINSQTTRTTDHWTTRILLRENCSDGSTIRWEHNAGEPHRVVQFRKAGHQSFTVCLTFPESIPLAVHQLRGASKKVILSPDELEFAYGPKCLESQCSHVSLMLQRDNINFAGDVKIPYQFAFDDRCPKCTDHCMKNIFCSSDYMFVGTVVSQDNMGGGGDRGWYQSTIKLERFIRHNSTFLHSSQLTTTTACQKRGSSSSSSVARKVPYPVPSSGKLTLFSSCNLKLMQRYFISANLRTGLKNKGRLTVACAQEDIDYSLYILHKMLDGPQCCQ